MKDSYQAFLEAKIDLTLVGVHPGSDAASYFCTPKRAFVIGWAGVDGIHYCFIHGFGDMVFSVSPMNTAPDFVHPLAGNFSDFLRLLLAAGSADALEQAWTWDRAQFEDYVEENVPDAQGQEVLERIREAMGLTPMEDAWQYIRTLQESFGYNRIPYTKEYYDLTGEGCPDTDVLGQGCLDADVLGEGCLDADVLGQGCLDADVLGEGCPDADVLRQNVSDTSALEQDGSDRCVCGKYGPAEWKVFYGANFCGHVGRDHAGKEIAVHKTFWWDGEEWTIPAVYACGKGLVIDFLRKVPVKELQQFMECWQLDPESELMDFTPEQQMRLEADNPLECRFLQTVILNSSVLEFQHSCSIAFHPFFQEPNMEMQGIMAHYALDPTYGWVVCRACFPWRTKRKPQIKTLSVRLSADKTAIPGPRFTAECSGTQIPLCHPVTGVRHTLTVQSVEEYQVTIPRHDQRMKEMEFPDQCMLMTYTISPKLPQGAIQVRDTVPSDQAHLVPEHAESDAHAAAEETTIIGGADAPTVLTFPHLEQKGLHMACSSLHYEKGKPVEWLVSFQERLREDICVQLIP